MARRDFHFKYENSIPVKKKRKPKRPAPPINAKRKPSAEAEEVSEFDEAQPEVKDINSGEVYIDMENAFEDDVKVYEPKPKNKPMQDEKHPKKAKNRFFIAAVILALVGAVCIGIGVYIAVLVSL